MRFIRYNVAKGKWEPVRLMVEPDLERRLQEAEATMHELQAKLRLGRVRLVVKVGPDGTGGELGTE